MFFIRIKAWSAVGSLLPDLIFPLSHACTHTLILWYSLVPSYTYIISACEAEGDKEVFAIFAIYYT